MNQVSASRETGWRHPGSPAGEFGYWLLLTLAITLLGTVLPGCKGQSSSGSESGAPKEKAQQGEESTAHALEAVFGDARAPGLPRDFASVAPGDSVESTSLDTKAEKWSAEHGVQLVPIITEDRLMGWQVEISGEERPLLEERWGEPEERFADGRAEWVWLDAATGIEVALSMSAPQSGEAEDRDGDGASTERGLPSTGSAVNESSEDGSWGSIDERTGLTIRGLAPMEKIVVADSPAMPEVFAGLAEEMTKSQASRARPEIDDLTGWSLPGWQGVEFRVVFGARNLQAWEVVFWTWHPGAYLVERWGKPEIRGDSANPQALWQDDAARIRASIPPRSGREVVLRFTRFVPATDWLSDDGLLAVEQNSWLGRNLDELRAENQSLIWAEDQRSGRVVVRLPSTEFGTDVVLEVKLDQERRVQRLLLRYAGTGYPELEEKVVDRLTELHGQPMAEESDEQRLDVQVFTSETRRIALTDKLAALELSIEEK